MPDEILPITAGADLSGAQYKAVAVGGTISANNTATYGILQNKPQNGEQGSAMIAGRTRYVAGAAVSAGAKLMVTTSGYMITVTSGSLPCGTAIFAANSGSTSQAFVNFANAKTNVAG